MNTKASLINWERLGEVIAELEHQERWQDLLLVSVATFTGCRPGDWTKFKWSVFIDGAGKVKGSTSIIERKPAHIMAARGGKSKPRQVFLPPQFQAVLEACYRGLREPYLTTYMFRGTRGPKGSGISPNAGNDRFKKLAKEFGLPHITSYSFRVTFARKVYDSYKHDPGHGALMAQRLLNHASITSTMSYIRLRDDETIQAFGKLQF